MVGIGETYFAAFALALGTGETFAGLVATLPMLAGRFAATGDALGSAAISLVPQMGRALREPAGRGAALDADRRLVHRHGCGGWIFVAASAYWAASQATGPAWNTWIEEIVPRRVRANFFACRARISQMCTLIGFVAGGIALQLGKANGWLLAAFAGIFLVGSACRFLSAWFLSQQSEPSRGQYDRGTCRCARCFRVPAATSACRWCCTCSPCRRPCRSPGRTSRPTCWPSSELSYFSYMVLIGIGFLGKVIALPLWGRVAHYAGARRLLWIGGMSIVPVAALWLAPTCSGPGRRRSISTSASPTLTCRSPPRWPIWAAMQLISGIVWAAYELAMLLMFFEAIPRQDRASVLTFYNFGNAAALVVGGLIGAAILQLGRETHMAYMVLFGASSLVRLFTVFLLRQAPQRPIEVVQPALRVIAVRADEGSASIGRYCPEASSRLSVRHLRERISRITMTSDK